MKGKHNIMKNVEKINEILEIMNSVGLLKTARSGIGKRDILILKLQLTH